MAEQNWAVDELLKSEEEANALVKSAKLEQDRMIKQAKLGAEQELSAIKKEKEIKFNEEVAKKFENREQDIKMETNARREIEKFYKSFEANKDHVLEIMMEQIFKVDLIIPQVLKGNYEELLK